MITVRESGDFSNTYSFLEKCKHIIKMSTLDKYGRLGVSALRKATPKDTGLTSESWSYEAKIERNKASLTFYNSNIQNGIKVAIVIQMGHGTKNGGWVEGTDYINPSLSPIFEELTENIWKEVTTT